jgi:hypothetical protein
MRTTDYLMSALAVSMVMNILCVGVVLAAILALRNDIRRDAIDKWQRLPAWARGLSRPGTDRRP